MKWLLRIWVVAVVAALGWIASIVAGEYLYNKERRR